MRIATAASADTVGYLGKLYTGSASATSLTEQTLPTGVKGTDFLPSRFRHGRRTYIAGQFSRLLVATEYGTLEAGGIYPPTTAPTMATGTGTITGTASCRLLFLQKIGTHVIQRSNPGPATSLVLVAQGRAWSAIPTTAPDARVTHVEGYVDMDGSGVSHRAFQIPLGVSSITETVPTATLAQTLFLPVKTDSDGNTVNDLMARGVPPYAVAACKFQGRAWYIDPSRPGVLFSKLNEPESVNPTSFLPTKGGEFPTAIVPFGNELVMFSHRAADIITGFGLRDFRVDRPANGLGCISHWSAVEINGGMLFFASEFGVGAYFGGGDFRNIMAFSRRGDWVDHYSTYQHEYQRCIGGHNRQRGQYVLAVGLPATPKTYIWKAYYRPMTEMGEGEPYWSNDIMNGMVSALGEVFDEGSKLGKFAYGFCDGYVRTEDETDADDDGDGYLKAMKIRHKHFFFGDQSGDEMHGHAFGDMDWFGKNASNTVTVNLYPGDDEAGEATTAPASVSFAAPDSSVAGRALTSQTSMEKTLIGVAGKGLTVEVVASSPVGVEHRGFSVRRREGPQGRPRA